MRAIGRLASKSFDPAAELEALLRDAAADGAVDGAVVNFVGLARGETKLGATVDRLVLQHHSVLTQKSLNDIAHAALTRFSVSHVRVVHRSGEILPGEPIVFAGAASAHRRDAFDAADFLMDHLKSEAVFWKREDSASGSNWIEPTEQDRSDLARWGRP